MSSVWFYQTNCWIIIDPWQVDAQRDVFLYFNNRSEERTTLIINNWLYNSLHLLTEGHGQLIVLKLLLGRYLGTTTTYSAGSSQNSAPGERLISIMNNCIVYYITQAPMPVITLSKALVSKLSPPLEICVPEYVFCGDPCYATGSRINFLVKTSLKISAFLLQKVIAAQLMEIRYRVFWQLRRFYQTLSITIFNVCQIFKLKFFSLVIGMEVIMLAWFYGFIILVGGGSVDLDLPSTEGKSILVKFNCDKDGRLQ